ncbi:MAG: type VI secretion system baseplate subunit TssF [Limnobacter sp.]|nr:type VI secretion system baseplate subunit TssF [Limnobacter sp.]
MMALTPAKTNVRVSCLEKPTPSRLPPQGQASRWQLVHGLSLQSFAGESGLQVLKDTLMLYSMGNVSATEGHIEALKHIELQPATTLLHQGEHTALCRGTHIHITLSQSYSRHHQCYLLGCLLHRFFASLCSINTFTQLSFYSPQETEPLLQWSPQTGTQPIL